MQHQTLLEMQGISKSFPGVLANDRVNFSLLAGEVHALLGENGAGKTTLMNILYGLYQADGGTMVIHGKKQQFKSPKDAMAQGVGLVAQHFMLARRHTVAENIALGLKNTPSLFPTRRLRHEIVELGEHYGLAVNPDAAIYQLSPGEQQRVEILKALIRGADILILDEPTSVLTPQEAERLFGVMRVMKTEGKGIIFISHKLDEVMTIADRVSVLRKGALVKTLNTEATNPTDLAQLMVGRAIEAPQVSPKTPSHHEVVRFQDVWVKNDRGVDGLKSINFSLLEGEILGVAGVAGNGQPELIEVLTGLRQAYKGDILLEDKSIKSLGAKALFEAGIAHIPEDRNHMGVVGAMSVLENLVLRQYRYPPFARGGWLEPQAIRHFAQESIKTYDISTPSMQTTTSLLSGGNVQKVILARELSGNPKVIVAAHPTYGLDVSAIELTHRLLLEQRDKGASILLVSEDLEELFRLSDRLMVLFNGHLMGIMPTAEATRDKIGMMMAGVA
ncbi:MAG: ABC transporter ATP-binding protein [Deinococcales bacterium]